MAGFNLDDWLEEQARQNPQYMQRQPDMTFTPDEAENAPDMTIGLAEAQRGPAPFKPDMSFAPQWMETSQPNSRMSFLPEQTEAPPSMDLTKDPEALNSPMLQQQMAQRSQPPAAGMPARGGPPMQNSLSSLLPQRDAEMDSRWRSAEQNALSRSGYAGDQPYGAGEAVRDFAPMAVGGALDVLLNKGKGLGYLAGAGMQANAQMAGNRQKEAEAAGRFASTARDQREQATGSPLDAAYKQAQIENWNQQRQLGRDNLEQRNIRQQFQETKLRLERDPNDPQAIAMAQQLKELTGMDVIGQLGAQNMGRMMPVAGREQQLQNAQPMAAAQTQGRISTELANEPATTAAAASKETATTLANKKAANPELDEAGNPIMPPGVDATSSGYATLAQRNPAAAAKVIQSDMDIEGLRQAHANLANIRAQIDAIPMQGRTRNNPEFARLFGQWQTDKGAYQTKLFDAQNRGVPQAFEQKLFDISIGDPQTWEDAATNPIAAGKSAMTDQAAMMRGQAEAIARSQQQFRQKWGFQAPGASGAQQNPANPAQGSGPTFRATPGGGAATARSGAMGQVGGMSSGSTGGMVRMVDPEGEEGDVPADQVEQVTRLGYRRVR